MRPQGSRNSLRSRQAVGTHLYRIVQEAVDNAVRHGDADRIKIMLAAGDEQVRLQVRDDGTGSEEDVTNGSGLGARTMNDRACMIGGTPEINSAPGEGTTVICTVPQVVSSAEDPDLNDPAPPE